MLYKFDSDYKMETTFIQYTVNGFLVKFNIILPWDVHFSFRDASS